MLFRTVFGPELPLVHAFISERGKTDRSMLRRWFVQQEVVGTEATNLDEVLTFLVSAGLVSEDQPGVYAAKSAGHFQLELLQRLMATYRGPSEEGHPLDKWYMGFLDHCFLRPNQVFVVRVHLAVNALDLPMACSEEKVNAWRRTMEFLGCGRRVHSGFMACYSPDLVRMILSRWQASGPLEEFLHAAEMYVPVRTATGDLADAMVVPLLHLERMGELRLMAQADYAGRSFLGERRIKWLVREV